MVNLTNEQIVDIINFYKMCGISEDMYLSREGVLDLFTLLGIKPEYDESGERKPTVYEEIGIAPIFREKKEVPIVFAIKHKVSKIHTSPLPLHSEFTYVGAKELTSEKAILLKFKQDYFSAFYSGNLAEATRLYDMIDLLTGGKADEFISIQFNAVKFYKKIKQQLLIDMFANFVILMVLSKSSNIKDGVVKFDKLYKSFMKDNFSKGRYGVFGKISLPKLDNVTVKVDDEYSTRKITVQMKSKKVKPLKHSQENSIQEITNHEKETIISNIKSSVVTKFKKTKNSILEKLFGIEPKEKQFISDKLDAQKVEVNVNILESDK